ncbi:aromatic amino acid aminotransferase [Lampropedia cohaerens]|uniref:Aromatic amino acid aminotransferase n=1 Tax=Lampropedia cohaerens TaxID=1610491 RepID=A0A0U1PZY5_9BURK|nr:aromatic amino acid aminotransferase [Lampropedia cohaerens]
MSAASSIFAHVPAYGGDPILSLMEAFQHDPRPEKVSLSIGLYFDEQGRVPVLEAVRRAEAAVVQEATPRVYLPMEGAADFRAAVQELVFGTGSPAIAAQRIATIQTLGGSGALKVGADFLQRYFPESGVWVSDPTWENHVAIFEGAGFSVATYPYYDAATGALALPAMLAALRALPRGSIVVLHASCHNPTGVDLTRAQWQQIIPVLLEGGLIPFIDMAYQGFGDGLDEDAWIVRALTEAGAQCFVANSFSKSFSLYGERCGGLSVVCNDAATAQTVLGQLKAAVRRNYSSPPLHGARIVTHVLQNAPLRQLWEQDLATMRQRIKAMRAQLHAALTQHFGGQRNVDYFLTQRGMFSYTGLSPAQVERLRQEYAVYLVGSGRMCMCGLTEGNVAYVADAIAKVME